MAKQNKNNVKEKPKQFKASLKTLFKFLSSYKWGIIVSIIFSALGAAFAIFGPKILVKITEEIIIGIMPGASINFIKINTIGIWLVVLYIISAVLNGTQNFILSVSTANMAMSLRQKVSQKVNSLPLKYFDEHLHGDLLSRLTNDISTITDSLYESISSIISSITLVLGIFIMMLTISLQLTLIAVITIPLSFVLVSVIVKNSQQFFRNQQSILGDMNAYIEETYTNNQIIKIFNGQEKARQDFEQYNAKLRKNSLKAQFFNSLIMPIMRFVGNLGFVGVCVWGGIIALDNPIFIASIIAFMQYVRKFNQPITEIASFFGTMQSTLAASERVFEFLAMEEQPAEVKKSEKIKNIKGQVEFRNVSFGYDSNKKVIKDFSFVAKPGQKIAIVGPTGAGKTTLVNLLMRFYEIDEGDILIDNVSIKNMTRKDVRKLFAMVLQDSWLFEGTIMDNLKFSNPKAKDALVYKACETAGVDHYIKTLPNSYNFFINEEASLSGGQKQLLTIARAMLQDAPMLILDEATSSIDTRTEQLIQSAMDKLTKNKTTFVIAHRLSTIKNADLILVLKDGSVIEKGTHKQLMEQESFYKELYNSQFTKKDAEVIEI